MSFKRIIVYALICFVAAVSNAQNFEIKKFEMLPGDLSAKIEAVKDNNDKSCALIKVGLPLDGVSFEGSIIGIPKFKNGEYWVYMTSGAQKLRIKHSSYVPIMVTFSQYLQKDIEGSMTYYLEVSKGQQLKEEDVTFKITPSNAILIIDQNEVSTVNGSVTLPLTCEEHSYTVVAEGFKTEGNRFVVYPNQTNKHIIELENSRSNNSGKATNSSSSRMSGWHSSEKYSKPSYLSLVLRDGNGIRKYVTEAEWKDFPNKNAYTKEGICMIQDGERFILAWTDEYDAVGYSDFYTVVSEYSDFLPTKSQADIIQNCERLREVAEIFGGDNYGNYYWTKTQCPDPDADCCFIFCPGIPDAPYDRCPKDGGGNAGVVKVFPL